MTKTSSSKMIKAASEEKPYAAGREQHCTAAVSETAAYYQPQTSLTLPGIRIPKPCSSPEPYSIPKTAEAIPQHTTITIIDSGKTQEEIMLSESPIYPQPAKYWTDRDELVCKRTLELLLSECRRVPVLAAYLNCTRDQVYKAMRRHGIKRPAYFSYTYHDFLMKKPQQEKR